MGRNRRPQCRAAFRYRTCDADLQRISHRRRRARDERFAIERDAEAVDSLERRAGRGSAACQAAPAHRIESKANFVLARRIERVLMNGRVGAVEDERANVLRIARREHLAEERSVRLAIEIDRCLLQRRKNSCKVSHRLTRSEEIGGVHERAARCTVRLVQLRAALRDGIRKGNGAPVAAPRLQRRAENRRRAAGTALVHHQQVVPREQRAEQRAILIARAGGGIAGTAFFRDDRPAGCADTAGIHWYRIDNVPSLRSCQFNGTFSRPQ